jgi:uncharacterized membrane protein
MPFQAYYFIAIIVIFGLIALAMSYSIKKHNAKMANLKSKKPRRR